jgi:hypothetical protein
MLIQSLFRPLDSVSLSGEEWVPEVKPWTLGAIAERSWQQDVDHRVTKKFGFREVCIRFYNQLRYSVFGEITHFIEEGEDRILFEKVYENAMCGGNDIGYAAMSQKVDSILILDSLLRQNGQNLMLVLAPNKWRFYSDKIEIDAIDTFPNYERIRIGLLSSKVAMLDVIGWFDTLQSPHSLISKSGTHWSVHGASIVGMQIQKHLIELGLSDLQFEISELETSNAPRYTDRDLHDLLNIMSNPPLDNLAYPTLSFPNKKKPRVLVVGDSYYLTMYYLNIHTQGFDPESKLLYYNKELVHTDPEVGVPFNNETFKKELLAADIVIIESNEDALSKFGWGFLSDAITTLSE